MRHRTRRIATCFAIAGATVTASAHAQTPEQIASAYLKDRNSELVSGPVKDAATPPTDAVAPDLAAREDRLKAKLRSRREELSASGERYTRATTTTHVLKTTRTGQRLVLRIEEETRLDYERVDGTEPPFTSFVAPRDFSFALTPKGGWVLRDVRLTDRNAIVPVNDVETAAAEMTGNEAAAAGKAPSATSRVSGGGTTAMKAYSYSAMANYATKYWRNYNSAYRRMTNDCTNFISQAMRAGGWAMNSGWYRSNSSWWYNSLNQSFPWGGAENWYWFASSHSHRTYILSNVWSMGLADVLQMDFDRNNNINHTMIVTSVGSSQRYLTYHTTDHLNRSLSSILSSYPSAWYYAHRT